ncbi:hypothetical protein Tsubulata_033935 [Turnera subulata]|uniref:RING-type domain-containing protein n=1 Tax=Turnera subulata TaxID=218843 RepID=A0A9Q0G2P2_9ROSI|nr:hypothetical protein Tsubulata_033935 [Turnera subulata]
MEATTANVAGSWPDWMDVDEAPTEPDLMDVDEVPPVQLRVVRQEPQVEVLVNVVGMGNDVPIRRRDFIVPLWRLEAEESAIEEIKRMLLGAGAEGLDLHAVKLAAEEVVYAVARNQRQLVLHSALLHEGYGVVRVGYWEVSSIVRVMKLPSKTSEKENRLARHLKIINHATIPQLDGESCAICLEDFKKDEDIKKDDDEDDDDIARLPCLHYFHFGCVVKWLKDHPSFPLCRKKLPC